MTLIKVIRLNALCLLGPEEHCHLSCAYQLDNQDELGVGIHFNLRQLLTFFMQTIVYPGICFRARGGDL